MKILVCMAHPGHARNFELVLRAWAKHGHEVRVMCDRMEKHNLPGHADLLAGLQAEYPNISSARVPGGGEAEWPMVGLALRYAIDYLRYLEPPFEGATKLRERAGQRAPGWLRRLAELPVVGAPPCRRLARSSLRLAHRTIPLVPAIIDTLAQHRPDVVVVTPLVEIGSQQTEYVRAGRQLGIPTCLAVASWDNLTTKGVISDVPDVVTVWNERQVLECERLHGVARDRVVMTGAVAYDHWFHWSVSRTRDDFCTAIGLDPSRPYALYLGSSGFIAPDEAAFAARLINGLRAHDGGRLADLQVLVRPHPLNPLAGAGANALAMLDDVVVYPPAGANPTDATTRRDYFDSIFHSSVALGVNTSGFIEASIVDRPVHVLLAPEYATTQEGTPHFHHLLPQNGGMLHVASSFQELGAAVARSLAHGDDGRNSRFVAHFVRPFGLDEAASPRLVELVERLGAGERVTGGVESQPLTRAEALVGRLIALGVRSYVRRRTRRERAG
jgi:hypothetical protein